MASRPDIGPQCYGLFYIATSLMRKPMRKLIVEICANDTLTVEWALGALEIVARRIKKRRKHCLKHGGGGQWTVIMKRTSGWRVTSVLARAFLVARRNLHCKVIQN